MTSVPENKLTGKQKRRLRSLGQTLQAVVNVGKAGMSDSVIARIDTLLTRHELIKVRLLSLNADDRREMAEALAKAASSECVGIVGGTILLYRPSDQAPLEKKIKLP